MKDLALTQLLEDRSTVRFLPIFARFIAKYRAAIVSAVCANYSLPVVNTNCQDIYHDFEVWNSYFEMRKATPSGAGLLEPFDEDYYTMENLFRQLEVPKTEVIDNTVDCVTQFLTHKIIEKLALPELRAYHVEDILEARLKLKTELLEFKAGILDLVWLLGQRVDLNGDLSGLEKECNILIETKIKAALMSLEAKINSHEDKRIRRMLRGIANVMLEIGKAFIAPDLSGALLSGSSAAIKAAEALDVQRPEVQVASFIYKIREKKF
ncbi:MAG: hypothetical protein M1587_04405 [Thaumarchaeota archaeon]|nr:hypothetical protein [Nitrososphaerota archaeon]